MAELDEADLSRRMRASLDVLQQEFAGLRTGRASVSLLEPITVEAYGNQTPLNQVATISVAEARLLTVQVWDKSLVGTVVKAIQASGLSLNPSNDGQLVRVSIPELNEERRVELTRVAGKYAEQARVAVRHVRRDGIETLREMEKDGEMSKDEHHKSGLNIQEITDGVVKLIDEALAAKEAEIMQV
jgi:ribosome recycling factor